MGSGDDRQGYTPTKLFLNGQRMVDDYTAVDAVADYMLLHPDADEAQVTAEVEKIAG